MSMRRVCDAKLTQDLLQTYTSLQRSKSISGCDAAAKSPSAKALRGSGGYCGAATAARGSPFEEDAQKDFSVRNQHGQVKHRARHADQRQALPGGTAGGTGGGGGGAPPPPAPPPLRCGDQASAVAGVACAVGVGRLSPSSSALTTRSPRPKPTLMPMPVCISTTEVWSSMARAENGPGPLLP